MRYTLPTLLLTTLFTLTSADESTTTSSSFSSSTTWPSPVTDPTYPAISVPSTINCGNIYSSCLNSSDTTECAAQLAACEGENPYSPKVTGSVSVSSAAVVVTTSSAPVSSAIISSARPWTNSTLTSIPTGTKIGTAGVASASAGSGNASASQSPVSVYEGAAAGVNAVGVVSVVALLGAVGLLL